MKTKTKPKGKAVGTGLKKKVGPFPIAVWIVFGALAIFIFIKMRSRSTSTTGVDTTATVTPTTTVTPQQAASAGAPSTVASSTFDPATLAALFSTPSDYVTQTDLNSQLDSMGGNIAAQVAAITFPTPQITVNVPPATSLPAPSVKPATAPQKSNPVKTTATKYFSYAPGKAPKGQKANEVVLAHGQTLHFTTGKGYYAA